MTNKKETVKRAVSYLWILGSFGLLDVWLRIMTRFIGAYSIFEIAPNLFTLLWAVILTILVTIPHSRKRGRSLYGIVYFLFMAFSVVQYGAYLALDKFLYVSDFLYASEGADYASWVAEQITLPMILQVAVLSLIGVVGIILYPDRKRSKKGSAGFVRTGIVLGCLVGLILTPKLYGEVSGEWDDFNNPAFEYERFTNANFDLELTGMYQYIVKDTGNQIKRAVKKNTEDIARIDAFFADRAEHSDNDMTGIFEGKNLVLVMLESIDDFLITAEDMPTTYKMMSEGICFSQMYTPQYANGYTFNTEFASNTSLYPYSNGNVTYALSRNTFSSSIPAVFADAGYNVNSFHEGTASFYNRGAMHEAMGYERYHSYRDYPQAECSVMDDAYLFACDELYRDFIDGAPFASFIITYSAHLPYNDSDELAQAALEKYAQYDVQEDRELNILRAKARLTDDMFTGLLKKLEEDGLLQDTVFAVYADHYSFGLSDKGLLQQLSEQNGSKILERTPAFIYCAGWDAPIDVQKVSQITDLGPTLMNLFGLDVPKETMGRDIFDTEYTGYAIFPGNTWLTNTTYVKNGTVMWNDGMTDEEIVKMNRYVQQTYEVNDAILDSDYYAR